MDRRRHPALPLLVLGHPAVRTIAHALQCAVTLVVLLGGLGLIAWLAGIAELADLPWILGGAFGGSFLVAAAKGDKPRRR